MRRLFKADAASGQEAPPREGAGDMLRAAREARGLMLPDVASMLRIRLPYLQAIEDGRYADLPGAAYVSGFLRSYAEHVGLEPEVVVRRYKEEAVGRDTRQELYLPTPAAEGRMPGGALLFGALVLAGAVYGAWYYASATDRSLVDLTPALPERFVALLEGLPWRPAGSGAAGSGAEGVVAPVEAPPVSSPAVSTPPAPMPSASTPPVSTPPAPMPP
ncbi:MAG TPA: helix-turn-helix domain-containing protein, partial [Azospirillaceae bacterium]|nr:helix-turn-helix domain-containing protein [Azospirillaceae bacterium]